MLFTPIFTGVTSKQQIPTGLACTHEEKLNLSFPLQLLLWRVLHSFWNALYTHTIFIEGLLWHHLEPVSNTQGMGYILSIQGYVWFSVLLRFDSCEYIYAHANLCTSSIWSVTYLKPLSCLIPAVWRGPPRKSSKVQRSAFGGHF